MVDQSFDNISFFVSLFIESVVWAFLASFFVFRQFFLRNICFYGSAPEVFSSWFTGVCFVGNNLVWARTIAFGSSDYDAV